MNINNYIYLVIKVCYDIRFWTTNQSDIHQSETSTEPYGWKNYFNLLNMPGTLSHIVTANYNLLLNHTSDITSRINTKLVNTYPPPALKYSKNVFNDILPWPLSSATSEPLVFIPEGTYNN